MVLDWNGTLRPKHKPKSIPYPTRVHYSWFRIRERGCDRIIELGKNGRTQVELENEHACLHSFHYHHRTLLPSTTTCVEPFSEIPRKIRSNSTNPFKFRATAAIPLRKKILPTAPRPLQLLGATHVSSTLPYQHRTLGGPTAPGPGFLLLWQRRRHRMVRPKHRRRLGNRPSLRSHGGFPRSKPKPR